MFFFQTFFKIEQKVYLYKQNVSAEQDVQLRHFVSFLDLLFYLFLFFINETKCQKDPHF